MGKIEIFRPPAPLLIRLSGFNKRNSMEITIDIRFKTPPPPDKADVLDGCPLREQSFTILPNLSSDESSSQRPLYAYQDPPFEGKFKFDPHLCFCSRHNHHSDNELRNFHTIPTENSMDLFRWRWHEDHIVLFHRLVNDFSVHIYRRFAMGFLNLRF